MHVGFAGNPQINSVYNFQFNRYFDAILNG